MRVGALLTVVPVFSAQNIPHQVRIALGAVAAFLITPVVAPPPFPMDSIISVIAIMMLEVGTGLLLGLICRMVFFAVELASGIITNQMGLSFSPDIDVLSGTRSQAPSTALFMLTTMLLFSLDLHHWFLMGLEKSYTLVPIGGEHLSEALFKTVVLKSSRIFVVGLQISSPMIAISLIISLVFSLLGRAIPQMNVFGESFAIRVLGGLIVFGMTANLMATHIVNYLRRIPSDMLEVAKLLGGG